MTQEQTRSREVNPASVELAIYRRIEARVADGSALAIPEAAVANTIERYDGNTLGTAVALEITQALVPELGIDGSVDEHDSAVIDRLVEILEANDLIGSSYEDIARVLGVTLELGSLHGLLNITEVLTNGETSQAALDALHAELGFSGLVDKEEAEEYRYQAGYDPIEDEEDLYDDDDEENDDQTIVDDEGEEFEF